MSTISGTARKLNEALAEQGHYVYTKEFDDPSSTATPMTTSTVDRMRARNGAADMDIVREKLDIWQHRSQRRGSDASTIMPHSSVSGQNSPMQISEASSIADLREHLANARVYGDSAPTSIADANQLRETYVNELLAQLKGAQSRGKVRRNDRNKYKEALKAKYEDLLVGMEQSKYYHDLAFTRGITHDALNTQTHSIRYGM